MSNHPFNHVYMHATSRLDIRNTNMQADIRADIGATDIGALFTMVIHGCTDDSTRTSVILRIFNRISVWTVRLRFLLLKGRRGYLTHKTFSIFSFFSETC